ncbi:MAG: Ig-like domain repeat protein [Actinomycetota bacterium]|nr:Ig-like domain repeat protein [Actinomycetota bacterium]
MRPQNVRVLATVGAVSLAMVGLVAPVAATPPSGGAVAAAQPASTPAGPPLVLEYEREIGGPSVFPKGVEASSWLREPMGIAIDPLDPSRIFVAAGDKVVEMSADNSLTHTYAQPSMGRVTDIAAVPVSGSTTRLVITDWGRYTNDPWVPIDPNDPVDPITYTDAWGTPFVPLPEIEGVGAGKNEFDQSWAIATGPDRQLYVADSGNHRIQVVESHDGQSVRGWGGWGDGPAQFADPYGIAVGPDGSVYVTDSARNSISKFSADGSFITSWPSLPAGYPGHTPWGIDVGPDGNVYVIHFGGGGVVVYTPDGERVTSYAVPGTPRDFAQAKGIAVGPDGRVYVADSQNFRVQVLRPALTGAAGTVSGSVKVGSTLTATGEQWSLTPTSVAYQWLRGSTAIAGATGKTYKPVLADVGHRLSVRVTASKYSGVWGLPDYTDAIVTSAPTAAVPALASSVTLSASKAKQVYASKSAAKLTATVTVASGGARSGSVQFRLGTKVLGTAAVSASGTAQLTLPRKLAVGTQSLSAAFVPSSAQVARSSSSAIAVKVTKAAAKVSTKLLKSTVASSARAKLRVTVKVTGIAKPTGKVKVTWAKGKKKASKTFTIKGKHRGSITVKLPKLSRGVYKVSTSYQGSKVVKKKNGKARTLTVR